MGRSPHWITQWHATSCCEPSNFCPCVVVQPDLPESQPVIGSRRARRIAETIASTAKPVLQTAEERVTQRSGSRSAKGADDLSLPALDGKPVVLSIAELYPGSVGPEALLEKLVRWFSSHPGVLMHPSSSRVAVGVLYGLEGASAVHFGLHADQSW